MEDPPEINDFIRELGGSLAQEAGAAPGGGLSIPRCGSEGVGGHERRQHPLPCSGRRCTALIARLPHVHGLEAGNEVRHLTPCPAAAVCRGSLPPLLAESQAWWRAQCAPWATQVRQRCCFAVLLAGRFMPSALGCLTCHSTCSYATLTIGYR